LKDAIARDQSLIKNHVSLEIVSYREDQGGDNFGASHEGGSVLEKHRIIDSPLSCEAEKLFEKADESEESFIGVVGEPGVGKTHLSNVLLRYKAKNCSQDDNLYLFRVKFRDMVIGKKVSVLKFLVKPLVSGWRFDDQSDEALLELINDSPNVYIVADGLDEGDDELYNKPLEPELQMGLYEQETPDVIIKNLFAGNILPKARKLVTSRPAAFLNLDVNYKPKFNVRILGISRKEQEKLVRLLCNESDATKVMEKLNANPDLISFCYNPLHCLIIVQRLKEMTDADKITEISSTLIFVETLLSLLKRNKGLLKEFLETLKKLSELAASGMKINKFNFDKQELNGIDQETLKQFFLAKTTTSYFWDENILEGDKIFFFVHLLWQEIFASLWLMFFANIDQFNELLKLVRNNRWRLVLKFSFGFLNDAVKVKILNAFRSLLGESETSLFLMKTKKKALDTIFRNAIGDGNNIDPCRWALEANQSSLNEYLANSLPTDLHLPLTLSQSDASAIAYALRIQPVVPRQIFIGHRSWEKGTILQGDSLRLLMNAVNAHGHKV